MTTATGRLYLDLLYHPATTLDARPSDLTVLLALVAAGSIGAADFLGGLVGRRFGYRATVVVTYATVAAVALALTPWVEGRLTTPILVWGLLAGMVALISTEALFSGIGRGRPAVVTPISAVGAAAIATLIDLVALDGKLTVLIVAGLLATAIAVLLVTRDERQDGGPLRFSILTGTTAGIGTGLFYVAIDATSEQGLWLFVPAGLTAAVFGYALMNAQGQRFRGNSGFPLAILGGLLVAGSALAISFAVSEGSLIVVAALVSLYPAVTVGLAAIIWKYHPNRWQWLGLTTAIAAVGLLSI